MDYLFDKKIKGKKILKDILYEMVPREILERPKHGFGAPVGEWFKTVMKDQFVATMNPTDIKQYCPELDAEKLIAYRDRFLRSEKDSLEETSYLKVYNYLTWIKSHK